MTGQTSNAVRWFVLVLAIIGMALSAAEVLADILQRTGDRYMAWGKQTTGQARQDSWAQAMKFYRYASRLEPWQSEHDYKVGQAYEVSAENFPSGTAQARFAWASAADSYRRAVSWDPANGRLQGALGWAAIQGGDVATGRRALQAAMRLAPSYPDVRFNVARSYLTQWPHLNAEERRLVISLLERGARELPLLYLDATWEFVGDPNTVRRILPPDEKVRRFLLNRLTEPGLFAHRWAEQADYPYLRIPRSLGFQVVEQGELTERQQPPPEAVTTDGWTGLVAGWLSGGLTATVQVNLPPGEAVLYLPVKGESAGGVWPALRMTLAGNGLELPAITRPGWQTLYVLVFSSGGGQLSLQAVLTNGALLKENGQFIERRAALGAVRVLTPAVYGLPTGMMRDA